MSGVGGEPNRLANETSPYLLQHAHNPVDWHPWGPEALALSHSTDKPIFLSIGYSACHWCHVMERECFEDAAIAALMNEHFINVKVDREERPDVDEVYMKAVVGMTGSGGWPMSVFLTPELAPFFGATYIPPTPRHGRPGFAELLSELSRVWREDRERIEDSGRRMAEAIQQQARSDTGEALQPGWMARSLEPLVRAHDDTWGGFGAAPKFPHAGDVRLLLRHGSQGSESALAMAQHTLDRMARGGIHDQLAGGFHRYSTDERWCIPHFEKMLYDNAQLVEAYLDAHLLTGEARHARVAEACCDWALREMQLPAGGFASTQDADTEGEEGRHFVWTPAQLVQSLGSERGRWAAAYYDVSERGNFEHGRSALWLPREPQQVAGSLGVELDVLQRAMAEARPQLLQARLLRERPGLDDKVLTSWNGLMISALCRAHQALDREDYMQAARRAAGWLLGVMQGDEGRLLATARNGRAHIEAGLDDYAFMIRALLDLYESDFDPDWVRHAAALSAILEEDFADRELGGYFTSSERQQTPLARVKNPQDGALPAGAAVQVENLYRLAELTEQELLGERADAVAASMGRLLNRRSEGFSHLLLALDFRAHKPLQVVIAGEPDEAQSRALLRAVRTRYRPQRVVAWAAAASDDALLPLLSGRAFGGQVRAYVCRDRTCATPVSEPSALLNLLD